MRKKVYELSKKFVFILVATCLSLVSFNFNYIMSVKADEADQEITFTDGVANGQFIEFFDGVTLMGKIQVKINDIVLEPDGNKVVLPEYVEPYQVTLDLTESPSYEARSYSIDGENYYVPGDKIINIQVESSSDIMVSINFQSFGESSPFMNFPILAYFEDVAEPLESLDGVSFQVPEGWTSGTVEFKAKVCEKDGQIVPDNGDDECDPETQELVDLYIQGIVYADEARVTGDEDNEKIIISEGFLDFGLVSIHLVDDFNPDKAIVNTMIHIIGEDFIGIFADAPLNISYSYGGITIGEAIVTNSSIGDLAIFFGNTEVTLMANGPKVDSITNLIGAEYEFNEDGNVVVELPPLSEETTTTVILTIRLTDDTTITKTINIIRTAIELTYFEETNTVKAGYVVHKAYLYNNQPHSDDIFDAYLQVILYRDNKVVGYKQIQIDDEDFINDLEEDSGAIESFGDNGIIVFNDEIEGVNKVSVFLTNGPIDFDSDVLPSIEFGISAGITIEWGND